MEEEDSCSSYDEEDNSSQSTSPPSSVPFLNPALEASGYVLASESPSVRPMVAPTDAGPSNYALPTPLPTVSPPAQSTTLSISSQPSRYTVAPSPGLQTSEAASPSDDNNFSYSQLYDQYQDHNNHKDLNSLAQTFLSDAVNIARMIITETGFSHKTIKPLEKKGFLGGDKFLVHGILFKYCNDVPIQGQWIYGETEPDWEKAIKAGSHELKGANIFLSCGVEGLRVSMITLVDYRGFRLTAMCRLPLTSPSLKYGSEDAGKTFNYDENVADKLKLVAEKLNLGAHTYPAPNGSKILTYTPIDIEVHKVYDKYYVLDLARLMPPDYSPLQGSSIYYYQFRPEFVKQFKPSLCSDAFVPKFISDPKEKIVHIKLVLVAQRQHLSNIEKFSKNLETFASVPFVLSPYRNWCYHLHREGINLRYMGVLVRFLIIGYMELKEKLSAEEKQKVLSSGTEEEKNEKKKNVKDIRRKISNVHNSIHILLIEMISRALKNKANDMMRRTLTAPGNNRHDNVKASYKVVTDTLNFVCSLWPKDSCWPTIDSQNLFVLIQHKYFNFKKKPTQPSSPSEQPLQNESPTETANPTPQPNQEPTASRDYTVPEVQAPNTAPIPTDTTPPEMTVEEFQNRVNRQKPKVDFPLPEPTKRIEELQKHDQEMHLLYQQLMGESECINSPYDVPPDVVLDFLEKTPIPKNQIVTRLLELTNWKVNPEILNEFSRTCSKDLPFCFTILDIEDIQPKTKYLGYIDYINARVAYKELKEMNKNNKSNMKGIINKSNIFRLKGIINTYKESICKGFDRSDVWDSLGKAALDYLRVDFDVHILESYFVDWFKQGIKERSVTYIHSSLLKSCFTVPFKIYPEVEESLKELDPARALKFAKKNFKNLLMHTTNRSFSYFQKALHHFCKCMVNGKNVFWRYFEYCLRPRPLGDDLDTLKEYFLKDKPVYSAIELSQAEELVEYIDNELLQWVVPKKLKKQFIWKWLKNDKTQVEYDRRASSQLRSFYDEWNRSNEKECTRELSTFVPSNNTLTQSGQYHIHFKWKSPTGGKRRFQATQINMSKDKNHKRSIIRKRSYAERRTWIWGILLLTKESLQLLPVTEKLKEISHKIDHYILESSLEKQTIEENTPSAPPEEKKTIEQNNTPSTPSKELN